MPPHGASLPWAPPLFTEVEDLAGHLCPTLHPCILPAWQASVIGAAASANLGMPKESHPSLVPDGADLRLLLQEMLSTFLAPQAMLQHPGLLVLLSMAMQHPSCSFLPPFISVSIWSHITSGETASSFQKLLGRFPGRCLGST